MEFCKASLTFESADEILWCDHSNETGVLCKGDIKKKRSLGIVLLAGKYGILNKIWLGISDIC